MLASCLIHRPQGITMALSFLNNCRSFDSQRKAINFWGHDVMFEVAFLLDESALHSLTGLKEFDEDAALAVFDSDRTNIRKAAHRIYRKTAKRYCELSAADL
jgi:hypothetical protein